MFIRYYVAVTDYHPCLPLHELDFQRVSNHQKCACDGVQAWEGRDGDQSFEH